MAANTRRVIVKDMATGLVKRYSTTAAEAFRAASLPTAGWTIADWMANTAPTTAQVKARAAKARRNAERLALLEAAELTAADLAAVTVPFSLYDEMNTDWQAGYDF